jgi:hypothetical protein
MRLSDIAEIAVHQLFGRLLRRAFGFALIGLFAIVALYYASAASALALTIKFGVLYADLIMAGCYAAAAVIVLIVMWATRAKLMAAQVELTNGLSSPRNMQIAMLVEAAMLGYSLARKSDKST